MSDGLPGTTALVDSLAEETHEKNEAQDRL